jgi:tetratricopeptide (TPR) repeat protein
VVVHGLGGIGKTQLVVRYLHRHRAEYPDGVFWLRADREITLVGDLSSLAWHLELPQRDAIQQERQIEAVMRWLREHGRWLMVLDNLEPPAVKALRHWLPPGLPGHVLLTSRTPMWSSRVGLEPLPPEFARGFLLDRTGGRDPEAAGAVAEALGRLPLALEQAAAYLEVSGRDLASYAELLRTRLVELMGEGKPEDYPRPLASTWQLSFERLESEQPPAASLLRLCAFLGPDDIPIGLLQAGAGELPQELRAALTDGIQLDRTIAALRRYSLMERRGDWLRVHRLVQAVVRESLEGDQQRAWMGSAIRLLQAAFPRRPEDHPELWPLCARLLAHAQFVDQLAAGQAVEPLALGALLDRAGTFMWARGELRQAQPLAKRALAIRQRVLGPGHPDTAESLNNLAMVRWGQGEAADARRLFERALAIQERALGFDHPHTADSLNNLALVLRDQGELTAARPISERALAIRERVLGPEHIDTIQSLHNLVLLLRDQGERDATRSLYERALQLRERMLGSHHHHTASILVNLAALLEDQGEPSEARARRDKDELIAARALSERALATLGQMLGPEHRWTVLSRRLLDEINSTLERLPTGLAPADDRSGARGKTAV